MAGKRRALNRNYAEIVDLLCCSEEIDGEKEKEATLCVMRTGKEDEKDEKCEKSENDENDEKDEKGKRIDEKEEKIKKIDEIKYGWAAREKRKHISHWKKVWDELSECAYWWNIKTNETTWSCPDGVDNEVNIIKEKKKIFKKNHELVWEGECPVVS